MRRNTAPSPSPSPTTPLLPAGILTQYLAVYKSKDQTDAIRDHSRAETAARVDIIDAWSVSTSDLWRQFRVDLDRCFTREFGIRLPMCCKVPGTDLMRHFRRHYSA